MRVPINTTAFATIYPILPNDLATKEAPRIQLHETKVQMRNGRGDVTATLVQKKYRTKGSEAKSDQQRASHPNEYEELEQPAVCPDPKETLNYRES